MSENTFHIFTDGACPQNGKKGAYAGIGVHFPNGVLPDISEPFLITPITNQRAELYAILMALCTAKENGIFEDYSNVIVHTDSKYSIDSLTIWIHNWIKNDWMTANKKPVKNKELIRPIYRIFKKYKNRIIFKHVKAHTTKKDFDSVGNRMADKLAVEGANTSQDE
jgi:ribonuclease HI